MPESESLSEALTATETVVDAPAPVASDEQTDSTDQSATDSSLQTNESVDEQAKPEEIAAKEEAKPETQAEPQAVAQVRKWGEGLETDLKTLQTKIGEVGGEGHLQIMAPVLAKAQELPSTGPELETWSKEMFSALGESLVPAQVKALKDEAAWAYLEDPASAKIIAESLYGSVNPQASPELIRDLLAAHVADPTILDVLRPDETPEQRLAREAVEAKDRDADARLKAIEEQNAARENERHERVWKGVMVQALEVGLAPRAEVKKQYGLEFQKSDKDTPEISAFKERASKRYDQIVTFMLNNDSEMNRLSGSAENWAKQKDEMRNGQKVDRSAQRQKAVTEFAPMIEQRARTICTQVAKELAEDLKLFSPELSDRAKAQNLKDLPAQVLGGATTQTGSSGFDLTGMPDATTDPRGFEKWVAARTAEVAQRSRTPGILQAG